MAQHDETDFVDREFENSQKTSFSEMNAAPAPHSTSPDPIKRIPAREQLEAKVGTTQQRLMALKQEQERLEQERVALEELRRRRTEFSKGREEMVRKLTQGAAILEEEETHARRQIEATSKALEEFKEHLEKVQNLSEENWQEQSLNRELTRALVTVENARKEWIGTVDRFPALNPKSKRNFKPKQSSVGGSESGGTQTTLGNPFSEKVGIESFTWKQWAAFGLAMTWPVATVLLIGVVVLVAIWSQGGS
ncbi:MAG: hypothetical protein P8L18_11085 [Verrucomicrobiota bacterium]|nr:hypothetical protein [Verrucomicrobiota bacterium]